MAPTHPHLDKPLPYTDSATCCTGRELQQEEAPAGDPHSAGGLGSPLLLDCRDGGSEQGGTKAQGRQWSPEEPAAPRRRPRAHRSPHPTRLCTTPPCPMSGNCTEKDRPTGNPRGPQYPPPAHPPLQPSLLPRGPHL